MSDDSGSSLGCPECGRPLKPISDVPTGVYCPRCLDVVDHDGNPHGGLHRVGDNPWDYAFQPVEGQKLAFVDASGKQFVGVVDSFDKDRETGEVRLTMGGTDA